MILDHERDPGEVVGPPHISVSGVEAFYKSPARFPELVVFESDLFLQAFPPSLVRNSRGRWLKYNQTMRQNRGTVNRSSHRWLLEHVARHKASSIQL